MTAQYRGSSDALTTVTAGIFVVVVLFAFIAVFALWHAWVLTKLWGWFIVPTFGLPALGVIPAYGMFLIVGMMRGAASKNDEKTNWVQSLVQMAVGPAISLLFGWIFSQWM